MNQLTELDGFHVGDKVWADKAEFDTFTEPYTVHSFGKNSLGWDIVYVTEDGGNGRLMCFYTRELSHCDYDETPELDKLAKENWKTELIHEFLEFAAAEGYWLTDAYEISLVGHRSDELLAKFIGVDLKKIEAEKLHILKGLRRGV